MRNKIITTAAMFAAFLFLASCVPNLDDGAVIAVREIKAMTALRQVLTAETVYKHNTGEYGTLEALAKSPILPPGVASGKIDGYEIRITAYAGTFAAVAEPDGPSRLRSFRITPSGSLEEKPAGGEWRIYAEPPPKPIKTIPRST